MSKSKQIDLESAIDRAARAAGHEGVHRPAVAYADLSEIPDVFTGEFFKPRTPNHYEKNSGVPHAPQVELNRPTIRQRIENLINRDPAVLQRYMQEGPPDGSEGIKMDVPDDPDAPVTASERNYLDVIAAELAEAAPLPDEGLPRPAPQNAPAAPGGGPGALPKEPEAPSPGDSRGAAPAAPKSTGPTR